MWDRWAHMIPERFMRPVAAPLGRHMSTADGFLWESARMLNSAFGYVANEGLQGDYAEFGVLEGRTFREAWHAAQRFRIDAMRFHAYDSFEGLPAVGGVDAAGPFQAGQFSSPRALFDETVSEIPRDRLTVTHGFYDETLTSAEHHEIAVAWVDCDLYASTVPVLAF